MNTKTPAEIGIKQVLRYRWMQAAGRMAAAGMNESAMRAALHETLLAEDSVERNPRITASPAPRRGAGDAVIRGLLHSDGDAPRVRSAQTRTFTVNNLVRIWGPSAEPLRTDALVVLGETPTMASAAHWALISAAYPFWAETALQVGRLLTLQGTATQPQIVQRLRERYGDRTTVRRYAQYVIRAMVDWGVLRDAARRGMYEGGASLAVDAPAAALLATVVKQRVALFAFVL